LITMNIATAATTQVQSLPAGDPMRPYGPQLMSVTPDGRSLALIVASGGEGMHRGGSSSVLLLLDVASGRAVGRLTLGFTPEHCSISPDGSTVFLAARSQVLRRVIKKDRRRCVGGWFDEVRETQARVYFVDRAGQPAAGG